LLVADTPAEYADAIVTLFERPEARARLAAAGRARIRSHHDWSRSMRRLDGIVERCVGSRVDRRSAAGLAPQAR
jgi:glycosyltransferase involved in cell wall biosynthesis